MAGSQRRFDVENGKQIALLVFPVLGFILASLAVAARWYTRSVRRVNSLIDDGLCLAALATGFCVVTLVYISVFLCGEGLTSGEIRSNPARSFNTVMRCWLRMQLALDICWATSVATIQLAFLRFYIRLYDTRRMKWGCYACTALVGMWYIWSLVGWIHLCHPPGKCELPRKRSCIINGSLHVFFNGVILLAPLPALTAAQLVGRRKLQISALFFLGCITTVFGILRMDCAIASESFGSFERDPIGASWWRACFSPLEIACGIICCCVPNVSVHNLWQRERPPLPTEGTGLRRLKFRTTSGSSSTSNLNPANWVGGAKPQMNAFVTLENGLKSTEDVGRNEIKVTKDYKLDRRIL